MVWSSDPIVFPSKEYSEAFAKKPGIHKCTRELLTGSEAINPTDIAKKLNSIKVKMPWKEYITPDHLLTTSKKTSKYPRASFNITTPQSHPLVTPNGTGKVTLKLPLFEPQYALANIPVNMD
jgi:hypothetical protein